MNTEPTPIDCRAWDEPGILCERQSTHTVSQPDRHYKMPVCAEHVKLFEHDTTYVCEPIRTDAPTESTTWPAVLAFAKLMEARLQENIAKGTREEWTTRHTEEMHDYLIYAEHALSDALIESDSQAAAQHAADVANYALMIADACGGLGEER